MSEKSLYILTFVFVYGCFVLMEWHDNSFIKFREEYKIVEEIYRDTEFESQNKVIYWIHDKVRVLTKFCIINAILSRLLSHKIKSNLKRNFILFGSSGLLGKIFLIRVLVLAIEMILFCVYLKVIPSKIYLIAERSYSLTAHSTHIPIYITLIILVFLTTVMYRIFLYWFTDAMREFFDVINVLRHIF
ncbi:hypothetical protein RF11_04242 [Thelohanellus kitauei]|uniref:Uncharacterized protein n=1 Tax=Thelohanellus kitauei TaxID=669202 RepID=A0A0C2IRK9_THEKT|nr:hypothetical protein RF11_04241 [Thelohanellus kitauei]KII68074.1 hypothetical protein RF11_04242 [Thelohanellus kitauei]